MIAFQQIRKLEGEGNCEEAKKLSLKYNVLCKETAFIAIDKTTRNEVTEIKSVEFTDERKVPDNDCGYCATCVGEDAGLSDIDFECCDNSDDFILEGCDYQCNYNYYNHRGGDEGECCE